MYEQEPKPQVVVDSHGLAPTVTLTNLLFAVIIVVALVRDGTSAIVSVITGGVYFGITMFSLLIVLSGTLANVLVSRQFHVTERRKIEVLGGYISMQKLAAQGIPEASPHLLSGTGAFVPPAETDTVRDALGWVMQLYDGQGQVDSRKVHTNSQRESPGRLKISAPQGAVREYLLTRRILREVENGYALNVSRFPTLERAREAIF